MKKPIPFGKYYLLERINVGGMAEVFRAKAFGVEGFERLVAVKRILPNIAEDKEFIRMFIDEAKIAVQLNHANIAQIFDLGMVENDYYIALEHIHGRDVRAIFDRCRQRGGAGSTAGEPMPIAQACFIIMKVCEGLDYAHNKRDQTGRELNLVHRDVSPQNVLVSFEGEVKVIDFGIAKAAGKGTRTQAGILKGKFGYMSPEQVRGLPIDRRSDVFSCGIVLYELLTGERLFVGESDFSTLEKVRNVEILPPSTYNRRIPDELERIVLKALAKDSEERYATAIDLHDELQAFVYTAGEFYSRKDLAGWMKSTFAAEIEAESIKLESYRHMSAPDARGAHGEQTPVRAQSPSGSPTAAPAGRGHTLSIAAVVPPPPGPRPTSKVLPSNGRPSEPMPAQAQLGVVPAPRVPPPRTTMRPMRAQEPLEWDEDEQETSIYADKEEEAQSGAPEPAPIPAVPMPAVAAAAAGVDVDVGGDPTDVMARPDPVDLELANLARTARQWPTPLGLATPPTPTRNKSRASGSVGAAMGLAAAAPEVVSNLMLGPDLHDTTPTLEDRGSSLAVAAARAEASPMVEVASLAPPRRPQPPARPDRPAAPLALGNAFLRAHGQGWRMRLLRFLRQLGPSTIAQIVVTAIVGVVVVLLVYVLTSDGDSKRKPGPSQGGEQTAAVAASPASPAAAGARGAAPLPAQVSVDPASGFDLIVDPAGVAVKLDGRSIGKAPLQIRNLLEGNHLVELEAPPGFFNKSHTVQVTRGQAQRVVLRLEAMKVTGTFTSEPSGARVTLIVDGDKQLLGTTPLDVPLDPRKRYEAVFRLPGYAPATRAIALTGDEKVPVAVVLTRAPAGSADRGVAAAGGAGVRRPRGTGGQAMTAIAPAEPEEGTLGLMSRPPCRIFIDGRDTGLKTPQLDIKLKAGRHRVTLINDEFGLKETFIVEIQPGEAMEAVKDLTGQLATPPP